MPLQTASVGIDGEERTRVEVVALAIAAVVIRIGVTRSPVNGVEVGIVRAGHPGAATSAGELVGRIRPRVAARFAWAGNGVEAPDAFAGGGFVGIQEPASRIVSTGNANDDLVLDDERGDGG